MKKTLSLILTLMILASVWVVVPVSCAEAGQYFVYTSNGKPLNMRIEPNKNAKVIMKLQFGDEFWVSETLGGGWSYGHHGGQFGYVKARNLVTKKPKKPSPSFISEPTTGGISLSSMTAVRLPLQ